LIFIDVVKREPGRNIKTGKRPGHGFLATKRHTSKRLPRNDRWNMDGSSYVIRHSARTFCVWKKIKYGLRMIL